MYMMFKDRLKKLFIPHEHNNFKPDFFERASMGVMLVLVLLTFAIANIQALVWIGSDWMVSTILPAVIVDLTNDERKDKSLAVLQRNELLDQAAKLKAEDMAQYEYFAHSSPAGVTPWHWFDEVSYNFVYAGENLAVHFTDSHEVVDAWMKSPSHRENIMNGTYTEIGVGSAKGVYKGKPTIFVVQLFGTPRKEESSSVEVAVVERVIPEAYAVESTTNKNVLAEQITAPAQPEEVPVSAEEQNTATVTPTEVLTEAERVPNETVVMYSDLATTSRPGIPAVLESLTGGSSGTSPLERSVIQPSVWLQTVYAMLALLVVIALVLSLVIEWRRQHPIQIAYAGGLLAAMAFLFHIHTLLTSGVTIV